MVGYGVQTSRWLIAAPVDAAREIGERLSSELRAAWDARPVGPGGAGNLRRWAGALFLRAALRLDPELEADPQA